jgi:hypothetical protein
MKSFFPLILLERAGLARLRGDADGMARDLAEARRLFAEMGVTGWTPTRGRLTWSDGRKQGLPRGDAASGLPMFGDKFLD